MHVLFFHFQAGVMDFDTPRYGPPTHISCLSVSCVSRLSLDTNESNVFVEFCKHIGIDKELMERSTRSCNPTCHLFQEIWNHQSMTMDVLKNALCKMGKRSLFEELMSMNDVSKT